MSTCSGPAVLVVGAEVVQGSPLPRWSNFLSDSTYNFL